MMTLEAKCPLCGEVTEIEINEQMEQELYDYEYDSEKSRMLIQDALPSFSPAQREFLKTGYCMECQKILFTPWEIDDGDDEEDEEDE